MKRALLRTLIAVVLSTTAPAGCVLSAAEVTSESSRLFALANEHYASGDYEQAVAEYRQILAQGTRSAAVHYNLASALYKKDEIGAAILELEKASAIAPDDADIRANLEFLESLTVDRTTAVGAQTTTFFLERLLQMTSPDQDAVIVAILWMLIAVCVGIWIMARVTRTRRIAVWCVAALAFPLALAGSGFSLKLYRAATLTQAIVLKERVDVLSGPGSDNTTLFTVHEGLKVRVRSERGSWSEVSLENGLSGWVPAATLGLI